MAHERLFPLLEAKEAAASAAALFSPVCKFVEIGGSIARKKGMVHDIDLVLWPIYDEITATQMNFFFDNLSVHPDLSPTPLLTLLQSQFGLRGLDGSRRKIELPIGHSAFPYNQIPVELYLCEPDGSNYNALLQMRTGSAKFNQSLAVRAKRMGISYRAGYGIFNKDGERLDDGTEPGIFTALGLPYIPPSERELSYTEALFKKVEGLK